MSIAFLLRRKARAPAQPPVTQERRSIGLDGREVPYVLRRSARKSLALQLDSKGVRVSVPAGATLVEVERFIRAHARWLLERLDAAARQAKAPVEIGDGCVLPLLGGVFRVRIEEGRRRSVWRAGGDGVEELCIAGRDPAGEVLRALRVRALSWFGGRVEAYCLRLGRAVPPVRLSSARTRWGSCSSRSGIRLHWRLIHLEPALIDYVVAHEVAHLIEMNHSPAFWRVVEVLYPDWRAARANLRSAGRGLPLFGSGAARAVPADEA